MLNKEQQKLIDDLLRSLTPEQKAWLAGYFAGVTGTGGGVAAPEPALTANVALFYATETGNCKALAQNFVKLAKERGIKVKSTALNKIKPGDLSSVTDPAIFISSTHGEGDPPEMAKHFIEALREGGTDFSKLRYAVLGLGDRAYKQYCQTAVEIDEAIEKGGGKRFQDTALFDVDFMNHIPGWVEGTFASLSGMLGTVAKAPATAKAPAPVDSKGFSRLEPVRATIKDTLDLNDRGSNKETWHIELKLDAPLAYLPGDSAGILMPKGSGGEDLTPRLYSIASSPVLFPDEIHLTVAHASYTRPDGTKGYGICSHYLSNLNPGDALQIFIQRNLRFRLPEDDSRDIIMIGPGTGIAPFRAFVQERVEKSASGRNWLFFGEQHGHTDFLYQAEWQDFLNTGGLTKLDVAFSRDQKDKIYVQHRMKQNAGELADWLASGAHLYVCGSKSPMSEDVEQALLEIITAYQDKGADSAHAFLDELSETDRYVKDVY